MSHLKWELFCCETRSHTSGNPRGSSWQPELPSQASFSLSPCLLAGILGKGSSFLPTRKEENREFIRSSIIEGRGWNLIYPCHLKEFWGNPQKQMLWNISEKTPLNLKVVFQLFILQLEAHLSILWKCTKEEDISHTYICLRHYLFDPGSERVSCDSEILALLMMYVGLASLPPTVSL